MYMNGHGIMKLTNELKDAAYNHIGLRAVGETLMAMAAFSICIVCALAYSRGVSLFGIGVVAASLLALAYGLLMTKPHNQALAALELHREAMEAETARRGKG